MDAKLKPDRSPEPTKKERIPLGFRWLLRSGFKKQLK
jgi:hypothetical protein